MKNRKFVVMFCALAVFMFVLTVIISVSFLREKAPSVSPDLSDDSDIKDKTYETIIYDEIISDPIEDGMPEGVTYKSVSQTVVTDTESGSRIVRKYPVFSGFAGLNTDSEINYLVSLDQNDIQRRNAQGMYKLIDSGAKVVYEITDFGITYADSSFISIVYRGFYGIYGGSSPIDTGTKYFASSLNIDIHNMQIITSDMIIADFSSLKRSFCDGKMELVSDNIDLLKNTSYTDMFYQYNSTYKVYPMFYFTDNDIMTVISLTSDLGGYAVFSYNKNDAKAFVNEYMSALSEYYS